jgi:two-component system, sensor histidine kinase and response regulator
MDTLRVLVTDDEPGMRMGVTRILRQFVVEVPDIDARAELAIDEAECGEVALRKIDQQAPDILILDHKMPGISGLDVLERLNRKGLETLTIMITAYASIETAVQAIKRGAYDFLAKPFTPDELRNTVRKAAVRLVLAKQARKLTEERNEVRLQFMRTLSHELQAPLNAVDGYLDLVKARPRGDRLADYTDLLDRCQQRIGGMRKLIHDLLDMTQIESGRRRRELEDLDVATVARSAIETVATDAARRGITIHNNGTSPVPIVADRSELEIILNNLLSNAVKYNRPRGQIHVTLDRNAQTVTISVADTGIGIAPQEVDKVFQQFARIRSEQTRDITGSGLGLSIVKGIAHAYGGDVVVSSEPGKGSTFTVILNDLPRAT